MLPPFGGIMLYKIFIKVFFVFVFIFSLSTYTKDNYNRDDYEYDHNKARKFFIFFYDPYSGKTFHDTDDIEIDHIVPLSLLTKWGDICGLLNKKSLSPTIQKISFLFPKRVIDLKEVNLFLNGYLKIPIITPNTPKNIII